MKAKPGNKNKSNKSVTPIQKKQRIQFFSSFEEANEADAKEKANMAPEEHLLNVTQRIKEMYADELKKPMDKNLKFRND